MRAIETLYQDGHEPDLRELRGVAARANVTGSSKMNRIDLIRAIGKIEKETAQKREQCAVLGLGTEGSLSELKLRLVANQKGAVRKGHRKAYKLTVVAGICLGFAGLGISLPHISAELSELMNVSLYVGILFALAIDGGFITAKIIDSLSSKFEFSKLQRCVVWALMAGCLLMSITLNASQFLRHVEPVLAYQSIAIGLAVFLSLFVFTMFYLAGSMVVRCETKRTQEEQQEENLVDDLRIAADQMETLQVFASQAKVLKRAA